MVRGSDAQRNQLTVIDRKAWNNPKEIDIWQVTHSARKWFGRCRNSLHSGCIWL